MPLRPWNRLKFLVERQFVKGPQYQLLVMAALVGLIAVIGGLLAYGSGEPGDRITDSVWWAFLRLTDPGYLGDDEGAWRRIVSTALTVSGYVVFMGALIAILTQWLIRRMHELERGLTPVALKHHFVILGWTNRTLPIMRELLLSQGRIRRFLADIQADPRLRLVVLADDLNAERAQELRTDSVTGKHLHRVVLRSGSALNADHLDRAACLHAAAIIVPARTFESDSLITSDVETIKALLSLDGQAHSEQTGLPYVVAEIQDTRKIDVARRAYGGRLEVVAGDTSISRLMVQNIRHPGLSSVYTELLTYDIGNNLYIRRDTAFGGQTISALETQFSTAVLCGVVRDEAGRFTTYLNPPPDFRVRAGDALVLIAESYEQTAPTSTGRQTTPPPGIQPVHEPDIGARTVLILGWSRKVPALLREFATYGPDRFRITVVSTRSLEERRRQLADEDIAESPACEMVEADFTTEHHLKAVNPQDHDSILLMSSDRLASGEEADARSIVGYLQLEALLQDQGKRPQVLLELSDPHNERLMGKHPGEVIISPLLLSHLLAQVALRRELRPVFDDLFSAGGPEIGFRTPATYHLDAAAPTFEAIQTHARRHGETALGIHYGASVSGAHGRLQLNPPRGVPLQLGPGDELVVLMTN